METQFKQQQTNTSYDDSIFDVDLSKLALERSKTGSMYSEIYSVVKNLSIGMDLTKFQAPMFIVKPVSFLELFAGYAQPNEEILKFDVFFLTEPPESLRKKIH
jgi:hypothetical protein